MDNKTKIYKIFGTAIKLLIVIVAVWFIYRRVFYKDNLHEIFKGFDSFFGGREFIILSVLLLLMAAVNWSIESIKWRFLIRKIEVVPFFKAFYAVLTGVTVSIFTPNRVGEYAGRVFILEHADRWKGVLITMLGSFCQLLVTIVFGSLGFVYFLNSNSSNYFSSNYAFYGISFLIILLATLLVLLYFNINILTVLLQRLPKKLDKIKKLALVFSFYNKKELAFVLLMSVLRYFVFITQFYLLLIMFDISIPYIHTFYLMSLVYVTMSAIPTIALTELGVRGSVSVYFFGLYFAGKGIISPGQDLVIVTVSSLLWLLNLALPALIGAFFVFRLKFFRKAN